MFLDAHWGLVTLVVGIGTRHRVYEPQMYTIARVTMDTDTHEGSHWVFVNPMVGYRCHDTLPMFEASVFLLNK